MKRLSSAFSYVLVAVLLALTVLLQVVLVYAADLVTRTDFPELRYLWIPYSVAAVFTVFCLQVLLICIFVLVRRAQNAMLYRPSTLRIIDVGTAAVVVSALIPLAVIQHLNWAENANPPLLSFFGVILLVFIPASFGTLRVLRRVYLKAEREHEELEGVI